MINKLTSKYLLSSIAILAIFVLILLLMGRVPICTCNYIKLWEGVVQSSGNSQHLSDWYTFSHIIHGFVFYGIFYLLGKWWKKRKQNNDQEKIHLASGSRVIVDHALPDTKEIWPVGFSFVLALLVETGWEILENTPLIINRYRAATISLDYFGDSVINSFSDVMFMALGFWFARKLPVWVTITLIVLMEIGVGYFIRDNLTLNIIMLLWPLESIRVWQSQ